MHPICLAGMGQVSHITLVSRTGRTAGADSAAAVQALAESAGISITMLAADTSCAADATLPLLDASSGSCGAGVQVYDTVLHCAGVLQDAMLGKQTLIGMRQVSQCSNKEMFVICNDRYSDTHLNTQACVAYTYNYVSKLQSTHSQVWKGFQLMSACASILYLLI